MRWIHVDEDYLDYLRAVERKIPKTDYGTDKYKPFFGVLFEKDNSYYITQVSHPQKRHKNMRQQKDFYKLFDPKNPKKINCCCKLKLYVSNSKEVYSKI